MTENKNFENTKGLDTNRATETTDNVVVTNIIIKKIKLYIK